MFDKLLTCLRSLFVDPTRDWPKVVHDPVLGEMRLEGDGSWWTARVVSGEVALEVHVAGTGGPDVRLLAEAGHVVANFERFRERIAIYLDEAARSKFKDMAEEVRQLTIQELNFLWPADPTAVDVYLEGPVEHRLWICGCEDGVPYQLSYDT